MNESGCCTQREIIEEKRSLTPQEASTAQHARTENEVGKPNWDHRCLTSEIENIQSCSASPCAFSSVGKKRPTPFPEVKNSVLLSSSLIRVLEDEGGWKWTSATTTAIPTATPSSGSTSLIPCIDPVAPYGGGKRGREKVNSGDKNTEKEDGKEEDEGEERNDEHGRGETEHPGKEKGINSIHINSITSILSNQREKINKKETSQEKKGKNEPRSKKVLPPPFKVGTLEMYKRFPEAYDSFMRHHDCSALKKILFSVLDEVVRSHAIQPPTPSHLSHAKDCMPSRDSGGGDGTLSNECTGNTDPLPPLFSTSSFLKVMDLGCGTGRIEEMLVQHPCVESVFAYDKEVNMLQQCIHHTIQACRSSSPSAADKSIREDDDDDDAWPHRDRLGRKETERTSIEEERVVNEEKEEGREKKVAVGGSSDEDTLLSPSSSSFSLSRPISKTCWRSTVHLYIPNNSHPFSCLSCPVHELSTTHNNNHHQNGVHKEEEINDLLACLTFTCSSSSSSCSCLSPSTSHFSLKESSEATKIRRNNAAHQWTCASPTRSPISRTIHIPSLPLPLNLYVRPISFEDIQNGLLRRPFVSFPLSPSPLLSSFSFSSASSLCRPSTLSASTSSNSTRTTTTGHTGVRTTSHDNPPPHSLSSVSPSHPGCHVIICAWSLSYLMRQQWGKERWHTSVDQVLQELWDRLDVRRHRPPASDKSCSSDADDGASSFSSSSPSRPKAALVIIETLGKGLESPSRHSTFPERLEHVWGFERQWVRTDYRFTSRDDAVAYTKFFFGKEVADKMAAVEPVMWTADPHSDTERNEEGKRQGTKEEEREREEERTESGLSSCFILPECTGIWIKWKTEE